jgi:hypothetical protein
MLPQLHRGDTPVTAIAREFYLNEDVDPHSFDKMKAGEKHLTAVQAVMHESYRMLSERTDVIATAHAGEKFTPGASLSVAYFNKVLASKGDVRKTQNYVANKSLISYSKGIAQAQGDDDGTRAYLQCVGVIEDAIGNLEKYAGQFATAMAAEASSMGDDVSKRPVTQYFLNLVVMIDVTMDVLYCTSIQGEFDQTQKPPLLSKVSFKANPMVFDEAMTILRSFNSLAFSGKLKHAIDTGNFEALIDARKRVLHEENVLDVAFALLTSNKWTELLLLPLYTIRSVVYVVKFLTTSYSKISFSISQSLEMIRKTKVTQEEFAAYKRDADRKETAFDQATRKAAIETQRDIRESKQDIVAVAQSSASTETTAAL